ncbi:MAG TPA: hypothetical protein RMH99_10085 [Sandaracinaceae bacterium LLY-WYZ-13_1]|nr:hypothetical protein [Sandaracinaceae bacterium LLY-WYZ-13_1]
MRTAAVSLALALLLVAAPAAAQDPAGDTATEPPADAAGEPSDAGSSDGEASGSGTSGSGTSGSGTSGSGTSGSGTSGSGTSGAGTSGSGATGPGATGPGTTGSTGPSSTGAAGDYGGTNPPPPPPSDAGPPEDQDDEEDDDPYDFLWVELMGGVSYVDLRAIDADNYYPEFVRLRGTGPMGGLAVGFRIEFLSIGVRGSLAHYADGFEVGTAVGEVTLSLPIPVVKPYLRIGFGLGWHGDSNVEEELTIPEDAQTTVFGWVFNGTVGLDVYFAHWFAIGAAFSMDILNMSRQSTDEPLTDPSEVRFEDTGDAVGIQARGQLSVSFHF